MASEWYYSKGDQQIGPVSASDLEALARSGELSKKDMVWKEGMVEWKPAGSTKGLFAPISSRQPSDDVAGEERAGGPPDNTQSRFKASKEKAKAAIGQGLNAAQAAFKTGADRFRATFGGATKETISSGFGAFFELLAHPIQYAFGTFVLLIACALSIPGLVTVILIPVFVLGYIPYMQSILKREPASLGKFISFMRHGWDSLWHLLMLLGTFFVATAIAVAPIVIAGVILYVSVGTLSLGGMQALSFLPTESKKPDERNNMDRDGSERSNMDHVPVRQGQQTEGVAARGRGQQRFNDVESDSKDGFVTHVMRAINSLSEAAYWVIGLLIAGLMLSALLTPSGSVLILIYCIILMVATGRADENAKYDLVYDAFERMLLIARWQWKRLVTSGLWLVSMPIALYVITAIAASSLRAVGLPYLAFWIPAVLFPVAVLGFVIYVNIFAVQTAMQFVDSLEAAPGV